MVLYMICRSAFLFRKFSSQKSLLVLGGSCGLWEPLSRDSCLESRFYNSFFAFISTSTFSAVLNASMPAGIPQYALTSSSASVLSTESAQLNTNQNSPSLQQRLSNLNLRTPISHRPSNMRPKLSPLPERSQHDKI